MDFRITVFVFRNSKEQVLETANLLAETLHRRYGAIKDDDDLNYIFTVTPVELPDSDEVFIHGIAKDAMVIGIPRDPETGEDRFYDRR